MMRLVRRLPPDWQETLTNLAQRVWAALPFRLRERILLLTQSTFTVGVSAVLLNPRDEVLFLRSRFRYSKSWQLPGGFLQRGETPEEAIRREVAEETGYACEVVRLLSVQGVRRQHLDICYLCRITEGDLTIDRQEVLDGRFFDLEHLPDDLPKDSVQAIRLSRQS